MRRSGTSAKEARRSPHIVVHRSRAAWPATPWRTHLQGMYAIPQSLRSAPFTVGQLRAYGLPRHVLEGRRFVLMHPRVWRWHELDPTVVVRSQAALLAVPDSVVSHLTALHLRGVLIGDVDGPVHLSTNRQRECVDPRITLHRRRGTLVTEDVQGIATLGPERTFVDVASSGLAERDLVAAGDWLVHAGWTTAPRLREFVAASRLDGVVRARRAVDLVRTGVESPRETWVRLLLVGSGLPEPATNTNIHDESTGRFIARGDMPYIAYKVLVEYDGWQHERSAAQRRRDHERLAALATAGWIVVVIAAADIADPLRAVARVRAALLSRGWTPARPTSAIR